ncbi:MAG: acyltransferase [Bacteroidota bacterium]
MHKKKYFEHFDALRFLAFFKVFIFHLPIHNSPIFSYLKAGGGVGVMFFFVLSGFLITWIILEEKEQQGSLNLRNFFMRRILRIWPLYYLMILIAFLTPFLLGAIGLSASNQGYEPIWAYSLTFLENYRMIFLGEAPNVAPLGVMWSLCIEEHFYLIWGLALYFLDKRQLPYLIGAAVLIAIGSRYFFWTQAWDSLDVFTNLDLFAIGALPAYWLIQGKRIPKLGKGKAYVLLAVLMLFVVLYPHFINTLQFIFGPTILAMIFILILVLFIPIFGPLGFGNTLPWKWGKYTYGLYVYHTLVIGLMIKVLEKVGWILDSFWGAISFALIAFFLSLGISYMSYHLFELPFLKLKSRFYSSGSR